MSEETRAVDYQNSVPDAAERLRRYERELDPVKRKEILDTLTEADDPLLIQRRVVFEKRFGKTPSKDGQYADGFMRVLVELLQMRNINADMFGTGKKSVLRTLKGLCAEEALSCSAEESALYRAEWDNVIRRYFDTCLKPGYRRKLFGTMEPTEKERSAHIRADAWNISFGLAQRLELQQEMAFLCEAMEKAYTAFAPDDMPLKEGI